MQMRSPTRNWRVRYFHALCYAYANGLAAQIKSVDMVCPVQVLCSGPYSETDLLPHRAKTCNKRPSKSVSNRGSGFTRMRRNLMLFTAQDAMEKLTIEKVRWRPAHPGSC
jgi:hypothetical protein